MIDMEVVVLKGPYVLTIMLAGATIVPDQANRVLALATAATARL